MTYTEEFCNQALRSLFSAKLKGLKPGDYAVLTFHVLNLPKGEMLRISHIELADRLGCERETISASYKRLAKAGLITIQKNVKRASAKQVHKVIDRHSSDVTVNLDKFPGEIKRNPVSEDAKNLTAQYKAWLAGQHSKAAKYAYKRMKEKSAGYARQERFAQNIIDVFEGNTENARVFISYAIGLQDPGYKSRSADSGLVHLYLKRKGILQRLQAWKTAKKSAA